MSSNPLDGLYRDTHFPMGLHQALSSLLKKNAKDPNIPDVWTPSGDRQWLSLPRSSSSFSLKHSVYTFADAPNFLTPQGIRTSLGSGNLTPDQGSDLDFNQSGYGAHIARLLDSSKFNWYPVAYNSAAFPLSIGVEQAVDKAVGMILGNSSKIFLIGHGLGAVVTSKLYNEFRTGRLTSRRPDLLGIYNFGSPCREAGHTVPGGADPGGHGIAIESERVSGSEDLLWEFASPNDPLAVQGDELINEAAALLYEALYYTVTSVDSLLSEMAALVSSDLFGVLPVILPFRLAVDNQTIDLGSVLNSLLREFFSDGGSHDQYESFYPIAGSRSNAIETALLSIQDVTKSNPPAVIGDNPTEALTINYREPVSVSEVSFELLRNSVVAEVWFLDRTDHWRQVLDENSSPLSIRVGSSPNVSWYKYHAYTYPIVAKAIQFRVTRVPDSFMGDKSYSVGLKGILVRRNIYNRTSGLQGMEDETDALGNVISKVIKDWDASKAIDDNANTFWRSLPQPDPDAVVSLYLDVRDGNGNAQLVDKIYIDPVYAGQNLNLYYSNDDTANAQKLNPSSIIPIEEYQIASVVSSKVENAGGAKKATIGLNVSPSVNPGDEITVSGVSSDLDGTFTVVEASYSSPEFSLSYVVDSLVDTYAKVSRDSGEVYANGQDNCEWVSGAGIIDSVSNSDNSSISVYRCPFKIGPMVSQDCWMGVRWEPSFNTFGHKLLAKPPSPNEPEPTYNFDPGTKNMTTSSTGASGDGSTATIRFDHDPQISVGDLITVTQMWPAGYNGTYTVTAISNSPHHTVSYACTETGTQTGTGKVSVGATINLATAKTENSLFSLSLSEIRSVIDRNTGSLLYSKAKDNGATLTGDILRIPAINIPAICRNTDTIIVHYQTNGPAPSQLSLVEVSPDTSVENKRWPRVFYDTNNSNISIEFYAPGQDSIVYSAPFVTMLDAGTPINIAVGWKYSDTGTHKVYINARTGSQFPLTHDLLTGKDYLEIDAPDLPKHIALDGKIGFKQWRGKLAAHIIKHESYDAETDGSTSTEDFLANPVMYCNPDPILISPETSTSPASSLDSAVLAADWTTQQFAAGGIHSSRYTDKEWVPIWSNYVTQKGFLYLPRTTNMKYLKLEFTQLTPEPYPIYDDGIKVSYQVFPITVTQTSAPTGILGNSVLGGIASVNWLNPSTVKGAVNSIYGTTVQPVQTQIQVGPGYTTNALPNTTQTSINTSVRTEANSPLVYRRTMMDSGSLAKNFISTLFGQSDNQGLKSIISPLQRRRIASQTSVSAPTSSSPAALPIQGQDWYVFPGQTLRMPTNVVEGVTRSQVVTRRKNSKAVRTRFTTIAVHQYETKTVTMDASIAYFAGIREIQPYTVDHIDYEDPCEFRFDNYDLTDWSPVNVTKYTIDKELSGKAEDYTCITAKPNPYYVNNSGFDSTINYWEGEGWSFDTTHGHTISDTWQPGTPFVHGAAHTTANGTLRTLMSEPIDIDILDNGGEIEVSAWVVYKNLEFETGAKIYVDLLALDEYDNVISDPISLGQYMQIVDDPGDLLNVPEQNIFPTEQPASSVPMLGVMAVPLYGSVNFTELSGYSETKKVRVCLNVNDKISSGGVWFDDIAMMPSGGNVGSIQKTITTKSKFSRLKVDFSDSGLKKSDPMWAYLDNSMDPRRTVLAHYVSTIPDPSLMTGFWSDIKADWEDSYVGWGAPYSQTSISYSDAIYDNKRTVYLKRGATSTASRAGLVIRQELNFVPQGLFRICATFYKPKNNNNTIDFSLYRISGNEDDGSSLGEFPNGRIHLETLDFSTFDTKSSPVGKWYTHQGKWIEIPAGQDQVYKVQMEMDGQDADELYINDLWVEIAQIRYRVQLGADNIHDVTPMANKDNGTVGTTNGINQFVVSAEMRGSRSYAYSSVFTPLYLQ